MGAVKRFIGRSFLRAFGWAPEGEPPSAPAYVLIAAPHTSNWDFPFTIALAFHWELPIRFAGKHTLFRFPFGTVMKALGGIPIIRDKHRNYVEILAGLFDEYPNLALTVPAEGTRSLRPHWKSGFYHIARLADVPIVCGYLDFERKRGGFGLTLEPTGDIKADMDQIRAFYADKKGKFPEKFGPVRLREETPIEERL